MIPLIPFTAGVIAGAVALRLVKHDKARNGLEKAQKSLRGATVTSLEAIENTSAKVRQRLASPATPAKAKTASRSTSKKTATKTTARKSTAKTTAVTKDGATAV